jgi:uncharacterized protein YbbC (DUF1343 family)
VTDRAVFKPVLTGVALIENFRRVDPVRFEWRQPPYEYEQTKLPIDILAGSQTFRQQIETGMPAKEIAESWREDEGRFTGQRAPYLLY